MNPITHFLISWDIAAYSVSERRDRTLVSIAGIIPDADAFGAIPELVTRNSEHPLLWWTDYHHILGHNLSFALLVILGVFCFAKERWKSAGLAFAAFHLHLLGDLIGARGPDGYQWPMPYLYPFSQTPQLVWDGQWALNAWPNILITLLALSGMFYLAWRKGISPLEALSSSASRAFVDALRARFGAV